MIDIITLKKQNRTRLLKKSLPNCSGFSINLRCFRTRPLKTPQNYRVRFFVSGSVMRNDKLRTFSMVLNSRNFKIAILCFTIFFNLCIASNPVWVFGDEASSKFTISNPYIELEYDGVLNSFTILNKTNKRVYKTKPLGNYETAGVKITEPDQMVITKKYKEEHGNITVSARLTLEGRRIRGELFSEKSSTLYEPVIFPGAITGAEENQHFAIPYAEGIYVPATQKSDFGDFLLWGHKATMPFVGMTDSKSGIMITSDSPADTAINFVKPKDSAVYCMQLMHFPEKEKLGYSRVFYIDLINNDGYNEMARIYRKHLEINRPADLLSLRQKGELNKNVDKLVGSVDMWLGPEDMKSRKIVDDLNLNGIKKVLLNFQYGWKVYENEKRPEVIQYAVDNGMLPSRYDNFSDIFKPEVEGISPRYRTEGYEQRVIRDSRGNPQEGYTTYYNNNKITSYRINTQLAIKDAQDYILADLKENNYLGRFVDVAVSCSLYEDFSERHPMTRRQDLTLRQELLKKISYDCGMITGTEETAHWAIPLTHYSEGTLTIAQPLGAGEDWRKPTDNPGELYIKYTVNPTVRIPLKSLVYHDCHISGWYTGDSISKVLEYWNTKNLITVLYGGMNLIFPRDYSFWEKHKENFLKSIKISGWVLEKTGYEKMQRHDFLTEDRLVQRTQFSGGIRIIANFSNKPYKYGLYEIPPEDFLFINRWGVYSSRRIFD
ncbi:MAG: glycoside hydrolase [Acetivibrionales bacterium]